MPISISIPISAEQFFFLVDFEFTDFIHFNRNGNGKVGEESNENENQM
jgi:hypothetical protein